MVSCSTSSIVAVSCLLLVRLCALHSSGLGQLFCLHLFRLCPSPIGRINSWLAALFVGFFNMPMGLVIGLVSFFFARFVLSCEPHLIMLIVAVFTSVAGPWLCVSVWSFGHHSVFSISRTHCSNSSGVSSWMMVLSFSGACNPMAAMQNGSCFVCLGRRFLGFLVVLAGLTTLAFDPS